MHHHRPYVIAIIFCSAIMAGGALGYTRHVKETPAQASTERASEAVQVSTSETVSDAVRNVAGAAQDMTDEKPDYVTARDVHSLKPFGEPIGRAAERVLKKPFGLFITPETSPVPNDRFSGYHVGTDFETFPEEADIDVTVYAVCDGPLLLKTWANGYGGVAVQRCSVDDRTVQVIYGHIRVASVSAAVGDDLRTGEQLAVLGTGHSEEVDGVRKHLHLGIHQGDEIDIHGYVKTEEETEAFIDSQTLTAPR